MHDDNVSRGDVWLDVWRDRSDDRADWNGFENCFSDADEYRRFRTAVADLIIARLELSPSDVVADLGCGTGLLAELLSARVATIHAVDYSEKVLQVAQERRSRSNIEYRVDDLNDLQLDVGGLGVTKAYSMGALMYLDSEAHVARLISSLHDRGVSLALLDIPDADTPDTRDRHYDVSTFSHLRLRADAMRKKFPGSTIGRNEIAVPYVNQDTRFNFYYRSA